MTALEILDREIMVAKINEEEAFKVNEQYSGDYYTPCGIKEIEQECAKAGYTWSVLTSAREICLDRQRNGEKITRKIVREVVTELWNKSW